MPVLINMVGRTCGRLTVFRRGSNDSHGQARWDADCSCGAIIHNVLGAKLRSGEVSSCGCRRAEYARERVLRDYDRENNRWKKRHL